jgi:hypothetical protein
MSEFENPAIFWGILVGFFLICILSVVGASTTDDARWSEPVEGCDCESCRQNRSRGMVFDLLVRDLGMDSFQGGNNDTVISAVEAGFQISIRLGGSSFGTVVSLQIPSSMPEFPEFLMRNRVPVDASAYSGRSHVSGFQGTEVVFGDDRRFAERFSLKVIVRSGDTESESSGELPEIADVRARFSPALRARLVENADFQRWWVIGARGRRLEAHFSKEWQMTAESYRGFLSEAAWMLISIAQRIEISRSALLSWKGSPQWRAGDLVAGLLLGNEYDEKAVAARRPDLLLQEDLVKSGLNGAELFSDERFIRTGRELGYLFDGDDQCIHLEKNGISMRVSLRKVRLSSYASAIAPEAENVHLVTVLTVLLPAARKRFQPFRLGARRLIAIDSTFASPSGRGEVWDRFFAGYSLTHLGADVSEDFEGTTMEALFNQGVCSYFIRSDVIRADWVVEGYPSLLEIHQSRLVEFEAGALRRFINDAAAVAMVLLSSGRVLPDPRVEVNVSEDSSEDEPVEVENDAPRSGRVGLKSMLSNSAEDVSSSGMSFATFEEKLARQFPVRMELLRAGLSPAEQKKHLLELYEEYERTGNIPEL